MVPLMALVIVRSANTGPRTPATMPFCSLAETALVFSPSKVPLTVSFVPERVAVTEPVPARSGRVFASAGSAESRVL